MRAVVDSYLDKSLGVLSRIEKAWFAVFVMRYWRKWILLHPQYDLGKNFITSNAYMCIELNAHALVTILLTIRKTLPHDSHCFLPWLLGSQTCEKIFRAARSMTSTFSTIINFGMLGLMRRLHCLHIQLCLEAEAEANHICYPRNKTHQAKDGQNRPSKLSSVSSVSDQEISDAVTRGKVKAQNLMKDLGMAELLIKGKCWKNPPATGVKCEVEDDDDDDDYEDDDNEKEEDEIQQQHGDRLVTEDVSPQDVNVEISQLNNAGIIEDELKDRLHKLSLKRLSNCSLPQYEKISTTSAKKKNASKYSPFVEVCRLDKIVYIRKTTAVWLLQEGERVSTDRLFRVRKKQPYATEPTTATAEGFNQPTVQQAIQVGDLCVFAKATEGMWCIGRVLQFSYYMEKKKGSRMYRGKVCSVTENKIGVLCTWYTSNDSCSAIFSVAEDEKLHAYWPITTYICTLSPECFTNVESSVQQSRSITKTSSSKIHSLTAQQFTLTTNSLLVIKAINNKPTITTAASASVQSETTNKKETTNTETTNTETTNTATTNTATATHVSANECWIKFGGITLTKKERQELTNGKELTDVHMNAFQFLLKTSLPHVQGLRNTLFQQNPPKSGITSGLQIIHMPKRQHWAAVEFRDGEVDLYDSSFTSVNKYTKTMLAQTGTS